MIKTPPIKKRIGNIIAVIFIKEHGIKSVKQLDEFIQKSADERQNLQDKIKAIDKEMEQLSTTMEQVHTVKKYRAYYKEYKANPSDRAFFEEYKAQITLYENYLSYLFSIFADSTLSFSCFCICSILFSTVFCNI